MGPPHRNILPTYIYTNESQESTVGVATSYVLDDQGVVIWFSREEQEIFISTAS
jgi:hypothetical protein